MIATIGWLLAGVVVGVIQAALLLRAARDARHALTFFLRLLLVAAVLVPAALFGHPFAAALGWLAGNFSTVALLSRRLR